jgi:hypothetical protein
LQGHARRLRRPATSRARESERRTAISASKLRRDDSHSSLRDVDGGSGQQQLWGRSHRPAALARLAAQHPAWTLVLGELLLFVPCCVLVFVTVTLFVHELDRPAGSLLPGAGDGGAPDGVDAAVGEEGALLVGDVGRPPCPAGALVASRSAVFGFVGPTELATGNLTEPVASATSRTPELV